MPLKPVLAGAAAGLVLGAGSLVALDAVTEGASAQSGQSASKADVDAASKRASAGSTWARPSGTCSASISRSPMR